MTFLWMSFCVHSFVDTQYQPVWPEKIAYKKSLKVAQNDFTGKMIDFDTFTKIAY